MNEEKFATIKKNLEILECPLLGNGEDWWMKDLLITPGQHKLQILEWLLTKLDSSLKQTVCTSIAADIMPVAIKKMNSILLALGLNRKYECGLFTKTLLMQQHIQFWRHLTEIAVLNQECKTDSNITENRELKKTGFDTRFKNCCILIDTIAEQGKLTELFNTEINLLPPDIMKEIAEETPESNFKTIPDLSDLEKQLKDTEDILSKETSKLEELQNGQKVTTENCEMTQEQLSNTLTEFYKLCTVYSETYNNLKPWFNRAGPELVQFGPKLELMCSQLNAWSTFKQTLATIIQCCSKLNELENSLKIQGENKTLFSGQIKELNTMLQSIIEFNKEYSAIVTSTVTI